MSKKFISPQSKTDWERLKNLSDEEIDFSDTPELTPDMFVNAIVRQGLKPTIKKTQITLRLDSDILDWFKSQGKGYQTRINSLLRAYKEAYVKKAKEI